GVYRNASGRELTLRLDRDELMLERAGQRRVALLPALYEVNLFRTFDQRVVVTLEPGPLPPKGLTLIEGGRPDAFMRAANEPLSSEAARATERSRTTPVERATALRP